MSAKASSGFIIGPWADAVFLIGQPILALALAYAVALDPSRLLVLLLAISPAHVFIVLYRSHGNLAVFRRFPLRFTLVPVALFAAVLSSAWVFAVVFFVRLLWDVHHGYMQMFGIGRIYDAKQGNDALVGRRLDMVMCGLFYVGPILSGIYLLRYVEALSAFDPASVFFASMNTLALVDAHQGHLRWAIVAVAVLFCSFYVYQYWRYSQQGYTISRQKVALHVCTALVCVWAWGFNPLGMGFFTIGIFHAVQYFAIVWWSERKALMSRLGVEKNPRGPAIALLVVLIPAAIFASISQMVPQSAPHVMSFFYVWLCLSLTLEIMHYWYDGFIWSVRKKEVGELAGSSRVVSA